MDTDGIRELLTDAATRAASYVEQLPGRHVGPLPGAIERLIDGLGGPMPEHPSAAAEILAFLDAYGSPATVACAAAGISGS